MINRFYTILILFVAMALFNFGTKKKPYRAIEEGTILNLYDAFSKDTSLTKDFGFSCITKYKGKTILFDAGSNADIFQHNTTKLGIDLRKVDMVIVSHGHFDHLNGLDYLLQINPHVKIYFPYDIFWGAPVPYDATGQEPGVKDSLPRSNQYFDGGATKFVINQSGRFWKANIEFVKNAKDIIPGLKIITTSSGYMGYFSCYPNKSFVDGQFTQQKDDCKQTGLPELSLSLKTDHGEVLIVGCSHTGVENIISETKKVTGDTIDLVYGGFHMIPFDRKQTHLLVDKIKNELKVQRVAPAHCTGHLAFKMLQDQYGQSDLYAGLGAPLKY
ncbi:MAG: MBL fold metallo-hydrolase [Saprospiraceae bacterium]|nr:MBL fold metallo-hydrolase [Saprospiraceae bacterium]HMW39746.1 MBL fold metallo-hydrolase [Saprospiraceae bacterium]HMX89312.1 MBL fold metallo-hydrolase [Saprospiraceae bacterium]HMZ41192.1 MBL fold metallo-hydrolase [Saprospiraceae bacterium]HNA64071.1 MBL fold metallo-hydrolase [Saprospiraceae bacterium]